MCLHRHICDPHSCCGTRRPQICHEFERFSVYMTSVKVANFYGGIPIKQNKEQLESDPPHVVVGTPGRIKQVPPPTTQQRPAAAKEEK